MVKINPIFMRFNIEQTCTNLFIFTRRLAHHGVSGQNGQSVRIHVVLGGGYETGLVDLVYLDWLDAWDHDKMLLHAT